MSDQHVLLVEIRFAGEEADDGRLIAAHSVLQFRHALHGPGRGFGQLFHVFHDALVLTRTLVVSHGSVKCSRKRFFFTIKSLTFVIDGSALAEDLERRPSGDLQTVGQFFFTRTVHFGQWNAVLLERTGGCFVFRFQLRDKQNTN